MTPLWLVGEHHGRKIAHKIDSLTVKVGRDPASDLLLPSQTVSRNHAILEVEGAAAKVSDLGSRNVTRVNGRAVTGTVPVRSGDRVEFGSVALEITDHLPTAEIRFAEDAQLSQSVVLMREDTGSADLRHSTQPEMLKLLTEMGQFLVLPGDIEETFDRILEQVDRYIRANRILLLLKDEHGVPIQRAGRFKGGRATAPLMLSQTMVRNVLQEGASLLTKDAQSDERFRDHQSVVLQNIHSAMAVPLLHNQDILGVLYADSADIETEYEEQALRVFTLLGQMMGAKLANVRLLEAARERERLKHEFETARAIQRRLLPQVLPDVTGYEMTAWQESCEDVGGDLYDFGMLPDGRLQIVLGDVSGKGVGAALLMSSVLGAIRALRSEVASPSRLVSQVDRHLLQTTEPMHYATLFLGVLDPRLHRLEYVNGGHPSATLVAADGTTTDLGPTDVPVGLVDRPGATFEMNVVEIPAGSTLIVISDGISEAATSVDDPFFLEGPLPEVIRSCAGLPVADAAKRIRNALDEFLGEVPRSDDATLVVVRRKE
jgi:sigma-B regulation protein RsbU (phosphoserine phosphatase)